MVVSSLAMRVSIVGAQVKIEAPWLDAPVYAESFEVAYNLAIRARPKLQT